MSKLLRFLIVLLLLLSITSLTLAVMLYNKRELLKGRTQQLEDTVMLFAATVEPVAPSVDTTPDYPARDIGAVTAELVEDPERSKFWETYVHDLECIGPVTMSLGSRRHQLMTYYRRDPVTQEIIRDPLTGVPLTDGPGTMRELLDELLEKSTGQYARLNDTRGELTKTRKELVKTVADLNERKQGLRLALNTVLKRDGTIAQLEDTVQSRDRTIRGHEEHIAEQDLTIRERNLEIAEQEDTIHQLKSDVVVLEKRIAALTTPDTNTFYTAWAELTPGYKGKVAAINEEYRFVVLELTGAFIEQYLKALKNTVLKPDPNLMVIRGDGVDERFVTKVRLRRVYPERRVATADILSNWQQMSVEKGDSVVY
jgi:uncharacterized coiled-coil protein SlyX